MGATKYIDMLGQFARDKVTGFEGVVSSVYFDLYGCVQLVLQPKHNPALDGIHSRPNSFDSNRIEVTNPEHVMPVPAFDIPPVPQIATEPAQHRHGPAERPD